MRVFFINRVFLGVTYRYLALLTAIKCNLPQADREELRLEAVPERAIAVKSGREIWVARRKQIRSVRGMRVKGMYLEPQLTAIKRK